VVAGNLLLEGVNIPVEEPICSGIYISG